MDFLKFMDLISSSSLFFCRADALGDPFEGAFGRASVDAFEQSIAVNIPSKGIAVRGNAEMLGRRVPYLGKTIGVNCWHASDHESTAMWRVYAADQKGIAVCSTVRRLMNAIDDEDKQTIVHVGMVQYVDYDTQVVPWDNLFSPLAYKRNCFEYERELRAIAYPVEVEETPETYSVRIPGVPLLNGGIKVPVVLRELLEAVVLAPGVARWIEELVKTIVSKFELETPIRRSRLDEMPGV